TLYRSLCLLFFKTPPTTETYTLSLHDALPILPQRQHSIETQAVDRLCDAGLLDLPRDGAQAEGVERNRSRGAQKSQVEQAGVARSEEHTSELQSRENLVCRLLLEKKKKLQ